MRDAGSHPAWVCGLKLGENMVTERHVMSHPAWVCGLKQVRQDRGQQRPLSHPAWVCGLKLGDGGTLCTGEKVTPCVGVWIETFISASFF